LEGSKTFSKDFMKRHSIPTADFKNFNNYDAACQYLSSINHRVVIKVSGLAAGKGVVLPETPEDAQRELRKIMVEQKFGAVGEDVVIEEFLEGDEISMLTFSDGTGTFKSLPPGQDHKRIFDGSKGPNTGGMGVYGPTDFVTIDMLSEIDNTVLKPTFEGLATEGELLTLN
jgi:phosphoribosylamine--glycine ligase/phosphoribosylformylglycinamidine cyclo-ligase